MGLVNLHLRQNKKIWKVLISEKKWKNISTFLKNDEKHLIFIIADFFMQLQIMSPI
jgi:hypothetical protein